MTRLKPSPKHEIVCPTCGATVQYRLYAHSTDRLTPDGSAIVEIWPVMEHHTCPPGPGLPLEVAA